MLRSVQTQVTRWGVSSAPGRTGSQGPCLRLLPGRFLLGSRGPWWPHLDSDPSPSQAGQRWLMGLKAPDSGVAPAMFSQVSRGPWEEAWRGASSERDSIIAYACRERRVHTGYQVSSAG